MTDEITVRVCPTLLAHLQTWTHDGATVASALFSDGRLAYPGRWDVEEHLGDVDPYTLAHEARVVTGFSPKLAACIRFLARESTRRHAHEDPTLELLWLSHESVGALEGTSLDRLIAALVAVQELKEGLWWDEAAGDAAVVMVMEMHQAGFPPNRQGLEELFDGAEPACIALGMVQL